MNTAVLDDTLLGLFRDVLEDLEEIVEVDHAHRALGPRSADPNRPRDVVCRLLRYVQKERILRGAWERNEILLNGSTIKVLPDLSRATLRRRAMLKPVLDLAKSRGFTYRWGYPLAVTFRKDGAAFTVQTPEDLPALFRFLETDQIRSWTGCRFYLARLEDRAPGRTDPEWGYANRVADGGDTEHPPARSSVSRPVGRNSQAPMFPPRLCHRRLPPPVPVIPNTLMLDWPAAPTIIDSPVTRMMLFAPSPRLDSYLPLAP